MDHDPRRRPFKIYFDNRCSPDIRQSLEATNSVVYRQRFVCTSASQLDQQDSRKNTRRKLREEHQEHLRECLQCRQSTTAEDRCSFIRDRKKRRKSVKCKAKLWVEVHATDLTTAHVWLCGQHQKEFAHHSQLSCSLRVRNWVELQARPRSATTSGIAKGSLVV